MKAFLNQTLLFTFLTSSILLNGFIIGPFSIRIYVSVAILVYLVLSAYRFPVKKEVIWYSLYIVFYWIALIINGEIDEVNFFKYFFGRYLICFIAVYAIHSIVKEPKILHKVILFFVGLGVINGIVSFMQFTGNTQAMLLPMLLNPSETIQERLVHYGSFESGLYIGVVGLFESIVKNGYFSAVFAALSLYLYQHAKNNWTKIGAFAITIFLLYTVFITQQRLVFIATAGFYLFYFYKNKKVFYSLIVFLIPVVLLLLASEITFDLDRLGRLSKLSDDKRINIYSLGLQFVSKNFFFGGQNAFGEILSMNGFRVNSAHNFFLNAFIYSGLFGAFFVIILYFKMLVKSIKLAFKRLKFKYTNTSLFIAGSLIIYLLNSLTHNASLVTGDEYIWILYMLMLKSELFYKQMNKYG